MASKKLFPIFTLLIMILFTISANGQVSSDPNFRDPTSTAPASGGDSGQVISEQQQTPTPGSTTIEPSTISQTRPDTTIVTRPEPISEEIIPEVLPAGDLSASVESVPANPKTMAVWLGALAIISFVGIKLKTRNTPENKTKRKGERCMHLSTVIEANLREITSLEEKVEDLIKDKIQSKKAGKIIKTIKNLKDKHEKYTKLFQDCIIKIDDKKKIFTIYSDDYDETKSWINQFDEKVKKMGFDHESLHISNPKVLDIVKKAGKDTMFVLHGDATHDVSKNIKELEKEHIVSNNMNEVVERLKAF